MTKPKPTKKSKPKPKLKTRTDCVPRWMKEQLGIDGPAYCDPPECEYPNCECE